MSLMVRINLIVAAALAAVGLILSYVCWNVMQTNARRTVLDEASLMMDSALATRTYTSTEIVPLLESRMRTEFLPQSVPFYAATNPRDRATDWEADVIQQFRDVPGTRQIVGQRETAMGSALYLAKPIRAEAECLLCHASAATAPATLLARYGSDNGFGWQANEVVGAHIVSVPLRDATAKAAVTLHRILAAIILSMLCLLLLINAAIYLLIVRPIHRIVAVADELSVGNASAAAFDSRGTREFAALVRAFERLRMSLSKAMQLLEPGE